MQARWKILAAALSLGSWARADGPALAVGVMRGGPTGDRGYLNLGPEQIVQASGVDIVVPGYTVPSFVDWDNDGRKDLVVGEGGGGYPGKVRVYLNIGTATAPQFTDFFYVQSNGADLTISPLGCLGAFPRVVYWDADARKDLLVGQGDGRIKLFLNVGTDAAPTFDGGTFLQVGPAGAKVDIDVGDRACPCVLDWNNDGKKDLVGGALDGKIHVFLNENTDTEPDFGGEVVVQSGGTDLIVPSQRSSPVICDLNNDGRKDLLTGNTNGQLLLYVNTGTDDAPIFSGYVAVTSDGVPIDLAGTPRSRPFACDWTSDGLPDVLIGAGDTGGGKVHLYQGVFATGDLNCDGRIDFGDIDPFVLVLQSTAPDYPEYYAVYPQCNHLLADCNDDGVVNFGDIDPFVALLGG